MTDAILSGPQLRARRLEQGLTFQELSDRARVSPATIVNWEARQSPRRASPALNRIIDALNGKRADHPTPEKASSVRPILSDLAMINIVQYRVRQRITRDQMSALCAAKGFAISPAALANLETGRRADGGHRRRELTIDELSGFASVIGVHPWDLTEPLKCSRCEGSPPPGFSCMKCGRVGPDGEPSTEEAGEHP